MNIAEKLTTIAENQQRVYDKGYADGSQSAPTGTTELPSYCAIPFWNAFGEKEVVVDVPSRTDFYRFMYRNEVNTTVEHITLNGSQNGTITSMKECFSGLTSSIDNTLKRLTLNCDFSNCTIFNDLCVNLRTLEVIDGIPIDFSSATSAIQIFGWCNALKEFRVKPQTIKISLPLGTVEPISNDTIQSIVDGLADLTGQTSQTMTFGFNPSTKLTNEQTLAMTAKNWAVSLMD